MRCDMRKYEIRRVIAALTIAIEASYESIDSYRPYEDPVLRVRGWKGNMRREKLRIARYLSIRTKLIKLLHQDQPKRGY